MRIALTASGKAARIIGTQPSVTVLSHGKFAIDCDPGTTLEQLVHALNLDTQTLMCIVDERSIATKDRAELQLADGMHVALMPRIRAG